MRATERAAKPFLACWPALLGVVGLLAACHEITDAPGNEPVRNVPARIATGIGLVMVRIEAGAFRMGRPVGEPGRRDDETLHTVCGRKPFAKGTHRRYARPPDHRANEYLIVDPRSRAIEQYVLEGGSYGEGRRCTLRIELVTFSGVVLDLRTLW